MNLGRTTVMGVYERDIHGCEGYSLLDRGVQSWVNRYCSLANILIHFVFVHPRQSLSHLLSKWTLFDGTCSELLNH